MKPPEIRIFNTRSKSEETFIPLVPGEVKIYHCGPTVYNYQHIGNMRRFIFADLIHRMFKMNGYAVDQIINITDVGHLVSDSDEGEDKIEKGAKREGKTAKEIAAFYTADFMDDLKLLNIETSDTRFPKATENIPEQIELISTLEKKGFTYRISDGIYFDTSKDIHYADFAHLDIKGMKEGARVEANAEKKNITDFALWKFSPAGEKREQEWQSPWGIGFPGWHVECSAMALKFLGETIDLHTGGIDHIPVHHTNEIAQSECSTGKTFARYWMHNEFINLGKEKMAKSGESFIRLKDLVEKGYRPLAFRYFVLLAHYRTKINFSFEGLDAAQTAWTRLHEFISRIREGGKADGQYIFQAKEAFNEDLDTPRMIALLWEIMKDADLNEGDKKATILEIGDLIGIIDCEFQSPRDIPLPDDIRKLVDERDAARERKDWKKADEIRDTLKGKGYSFND